jgi:signal transduction histidine kinase
MEIELRQAQKLESVGRLAAGVAHEINTPIQYVSDNVEFLRTATGRLFALLDRHREVARRAISREDDGAIASLDEAERKARLPYLSENVPAAIDAALEGLQRVSEIVRSMKAFAHPDQGEMSAVDLNQAIRSTLTVARNEYKYVADLDLDLGEIPSVVCLPGEINQVVLNLVVNAAHAIGDVVGDSGQRGRITVRTRVDGDFVVIAIGDTGGGIPESIRHRLFDPFFTTKAVGKGTGQGLAIARGVVVDKHRGRLSFETEVGKGTTFLVALPIGGVTQAPAEVAA